MRLGYTPHAKPKPVSYIVRKGYTPAHIARYKAKTGTFKVNRKTEAHERPDDQATGDDNNNEGA